MLLEIGRHSDPTSPNSYFCGWSTILWKDSCHTLLPTPMNRDASTLGRCPECGESISAAWVLVEYEKADGTTGVWAECPACADVVCPE